MATSSRNALTLKQKLEVLEYAKKHKKDSTRQLADKFSCGRTQIQGILKNKDSLVRSFEDNAPLLRKRARTSSNEDINEAMFRWFKLARQRNIPVSGPMLQEEAKVIAEKMGSTDFKASNGWLSSFKKRHNIKQFAVSGEAADVADETVAGWKERVKTIMEGYEAKDIWNLDETGCFYRALPEKTLAQKKSVCKGGKKAKQRLTITFIANAAGGKELPIVIGKAAKPRCFKGIRDPSNPLGIPYYSQPKAWMSSEIMDDILKKLNKRLIREKRRILLFLDNATPHDPEFVGRFSQIKIVFLPANTTSKLQPLDAGIIKNFKVLYRGSLLRHVVSHLDSTHLGASGITQTVDVLVAIRWIKAAWEQVKSSVIVNCFKHCGAIPGEASEDERDPFADIAADTTVLGELVRRMQGEITANEYGSADDDLSTCFTFNNPSEWREELREEICSVSAEVGDTPLVDCSDDSGDEVEMLPPDCTILTYSQALKAASDLLQFTTERGHEEVSEDIHRVLLALEDYKLKQACKQTDLLQFFTQPTV